jgi:glycine/D-amino acid oxidase-like deaminating enzyme
VSGSYWQREANWCDRWAGLPIPRTVDFAVLGAGFAGLATANALRERHPSASIVVLEAERVGFGASGRNAGFLSPLAAPVWLLGAERSAEQAWGAARINAEVHTLARWIGEHVPDCELEAVTLAMQPQSRVFDEALREFTRRVARVGLRHRVVESRARPGMSVLEMDAYTLHPYKLARGLAERADHQGVQIRERMRVRRIEGLRAGGAHVHLDDASIVEATKVVLCTNAYTPSIDLGERVAAMPVHSFMAASAPVDESSLARDGDFTVEVSGAQSYHRTHRGRLIYGGVDNLRAPEDDFDVRPRERARLDAQIAASFPDARVPIDHAWSGRFHATWNGLPILRTSDENHALVLNVGYGGTGVALSLVCAKLAASVASNGAWDNSDDPRLLSLMHATRISVRDSLRAVAKIARGVAAPWIG